MVYTFPSSLRLLAAAEFQRVWKTGKRLSSPSLTLVSCDNSLGYPRLGISISKKYVPLAVNRNRLKRLARETFRIRQDTLGGKDIVLVAYKGADAIPPAEQYSRFNSLWDRLIAQLNNALAQRK